MLPNGVARGARKCEIKPLIKIWYPKSFDVCLLQGSQLKQFTIPNENNGGTS